MSDLRTKIETLRDRIERRREKRARLQAQRDEIYKQLDKAWNSVKEVVGKVDKRATYEDKLEAINARAASLRHEIKGHIETIEANLNAAEGREAKD